MHIIASGILLSAPYTGRSLHIRGASEQYLLYTRNVPSDFDHLLAPPHGGRTREWTNPRLLLESDDYRVTLLSIYIDPVSAVSHIVVHPQPTQTLHLAVSPDGAVMSRTLFQKTALGSMAVIRGAGDGKRLFPRLRLLRR